MSVREPQRHTYLYFKSGATRWSRTYSAGLLCGEYKTYLIRIRGKHMVRLPRNYAERGFAKACHKCAKQLMCLSGERPSLNPGDIEGSDEVIF